MGVPLHKISCSTLYRFVPGWRGDLCFFRSGRTSTELLKGNGTDAGLKTRHYSLDEGAWKLKRGRPTLKNRGCGTRNGKDAGLKTRHYSSAVHVSWLREESE